MGTDAPEQLDLIFAADLAGRFSGARCAGPPLPGGPGLAGLRAAIELAQAESPAALVIGGGGLLGPGNEIRYLLASPAGSAHAAELLRAAGIDVFPLGTAEFAADPAGLLPYVQALRTAGAPVLISNLRCEAKPDEAKSGNATICPHLLPEYILSRNGVRVGLLAVVAENLALRVGPGHVPGTALPPLRIADRVRALQKAGVHAVVLAADLEARADPGEAVALVQALEGLGAHVDVVLATRQDHASAALTSLNLSSGTVIVGAPAEGAGVTVVSLRRQGSGLRISSRRVLGGTGVAGLAGPGGAGGPGAAEGPGGAGAAGQVLRDKIDALHGRMCQAWGQPRAEVPAGGLRRPAVTALVLDAMRDAARAEIALINARALDDRGLPLYRISEAAVASALPFPARVVELRLTGKDISDKLGKYVRRAEDPLPEVGPRSRRGGDPRDQVALLGLLRDGDDLKVNGRALDLVATYRVATIDFVSAGGDDLLSAPGPARPLSPPRELRDLALDYLAHRLGGEDPLAMPLHALREQPLWTSSLDLGLDLQSVTVRNLEQSPYDRPLLLRRPSVALRIDGTARVQMDHPRHLAQFTLRSLYGQTYFSETPGSMDTAAGWQETADLVNALLLYSFRGLSARHARVPTPLVSIGVESEWNRPDVRAYYHLELSALGGLRMALVPKLSLLFGAGLRKELLARDYIAGESEVARTRLLLSLTLELQKRALWPRLGNALLGELIVTYNFTDPQRLRSHELRTTGKLYLALGRPLFVTAGADLYLYADQGRDPGLAVDATLGLKVLLDARTQTF